MEMKKEFKELKRKLKGLNEEEEKETDPKGGDDEINSLN